MSDEVTPMYPTLFSQVQDYVVERLNSDYQLSAVGLEFIPEHIRDVEYLIKRNLGKQGMVGIVNTVKAQYGGHDGETQAWQMEVECDILENPPIRQAWMKKNDISAGTVVDCCNFVNESLAGPYSPTYGQFCSKSVEVGEDSGIVVGKCLFDTYALGEISGAISGESHYVIKWATKDELSALSAETWTAIDELSAELSGSEEVWNAISALNDNKRDYLDLSLDVSGRIENIDPLLPQGGVEFFQLEWTNPRGRIDTIDMVQFANEDSTMSWKSQYEPYEVTYDAETQKFNLLERGTSILEFTGLSSDGIPVQINWEWLDEPYVFDALLKTHAISTSLATMMDLDSLSQKVETLDDLAVKYTDDEKVQVVLNRPDTPMTLTINDSSVSPGSSSIRFPGSNHISQKSMMIGVPPEGFEASAYGSTSVQFGGTHNDADLVLGAGIHIISSTEKGKSQILMDDQRLYVVTPAEVSAGQTLKAVQVYDDPTLNTMSFRGSANQAGMKSREEPKWHWEYHSANLPDKTSDLTNDSGYVTSSEVSAEISSVSQNIQDLSAETPSIWRVWEYEPDYLCFTAKEANARVRMRRFSASAPDVSLEYTTDGNTWNDFIVGTTTVTLVNVGDKVLFRSGPSGNSGMGSGSNDINEFITEGRFSVKGNIMSLLDPTLKLVTITQPYAFRNLFSNNAGIEDVSGLVLPATTLSESCYTNMFREIPITSMPQIRATTVAMECCGYMFAGCTSLVNVSSLPATTLAQGCYKSMFNGCTSLTTAPELPATRLAQDCYNGMFYNCTSLTTAPELPATTLARGCYSGMFQGCTSLNSIKIAYTGNFSGSGVPFWAFINWVAGVSSSGTFYYNGSDTTRGTSAIPENWTIQTF